MMTVIAVALFVAVVGTRVGAETPADRTTIDDIRGKLLRLPYYGVFDFLAFSYDKGTVTLGGYAYHPTLKEEAERAVRQVARVDEVINKIENLPLSSMDDDLRWKTYYAIYTDPFLSRYAPGGGMLWGHRHLTIGDLTVGPAHDSRVGHAAGLTGTESSACRTGRASRLARAAISIVSGRGLDRGRRAEDRDVRPFAWSCPTHGRA
jgi:hypothetical protein